MSFAHTLQALVVMALWGLNFVVAKWALAEFPPLFVMFLRFALVAVLIIPFFRVPRDKLWKIALVAGGILPGLILLVLLVAGQGGALAGLAAFVALACHVAGVLAERWLFFAEARHAVMNYYGG